MWHYLYFTVLLKVKDTTEFTGPESYVSQMVKVRREYGKCFLRGRELCGVCTGVRCQNSTALPIISPV